MPLRRFPRAALPLAHKSQPVLQPRSLTSQPSLRFSLQRAQGISQRAHPQRPSQDKHGSESPQELKMSSLDKLGASPTVKTVVFVFVCIIGTVETVFWVRSGWRYFHPAAPTGEEASEGTGEK